MDKPTYVRALFSAIVDHYDFMNRVLSAGQDRGWRRRAAEVVALPTGGRALDVGAGTADFTLALARQYPTASIIALDFTQAMLALGRRKAHQEDAGRRITFLAGDALHLPFSDNTFDAVTNGFVLRNVQDIGQALAEMRRVTRPGGRVVCLELSRPTVPLFRTLFWLYFGRLVPWLGRRIARHAEAYRYLPASLAGFLSAEELKAEMERAGLEQVTYRRLMGGTVAIHMGNKL